jgi:hypothetical protein
MSEEPQATGKHAEGVRHEHDFSTQARALEVELEMTKPRQLGCISNFEVPGTPAGLRIKLSGSFAQDFLRTS